MYISVSGSSDFYELWGETGYLKMAPAAARGRPNPSSSYATSKDMWERSWRNTLKCSRSASRAFEGVWRCSSTVSSIWTSHHHTWRLGGLEVFHVFSRGLWLWQIASWWCVCWKTCHTDGAIAAIRCWLMSGSLFNDANMRPIVLSHGCVAVLVLQVKSSFLSQKDHEKDHTDGRVIISCNCTEFLHAFLRCFSAVAGNSHHGVYL